jgi:hypothetical protein
MKPSSPTKNSPLFKMTSILSSAHTKLSGKRAAFRPEPARQENQARTTRKAASKGKGSDAPAWQEPGKSIQGRCIQGSQDQERPQVVKLKPSGCYDKEIPSQRSNHSPDLPGNRLRHSLRRRVVAPAVGVLMALIPGPDWI